MPTLINGDTGMPVSVPDSLVERFRAVGFTDPAAPAPELVQAEKPAPRRRRTSKSE